MLGLWILKLTTQEKFPSNPLSLTYQTLRPLIASTGKLMSGPCLLQKLEKLWVNIWTSQLSGCSLSDWGGVCLCVESAPLGALVGVIVRTVEWVTREHYLIAVCRQLGEKKRTMGNLIWADPPCTGQCSGACQHWSSGNSLWRPLNKTLRKLLDLSDDIITHCDQSGCPPHAGDIGPQVLAWLGHSYYPHPIIRVLIRILALVLDSEYICKNRIYQIQKRNICTTFFIIRIRQSQVDQSEN